MKRIVATLALAAVVSPLAAFAQVERVDLRVHGMT